VAFNTATRDSRVTSAIVLTAFVLPMPGGTFAFDSGLPLLVEHGDADVAVAVAVAASRQAYDLAASPKWFVSLTGADHGGPFADIASPHDELVEQTTIDFWHGTLDGDEHALERLDEDARHRALDGRAPMSPTGSRQRRGATWAGSRPGG